MLTFHHSNSTSCDFIVQTKSVGRQLHLFRLDKFFGALSFRPPVIFGASIIRLRWGWSFSVLGEIRESGGSNSVGWRFHLFRVLISWSILILLRYCLTNFCWWDNYEYTFKNESVALRLDIFEMRKKNHNKLTDNSVAPRLKLFCLAQVVYVSVG